MGFRQPVIIKRRATGAYVNGKWVEDSSPSSFTIQASIQAPKTHDVQSLPEARRNSKLFVLYTDSYLQDETTQNPDIVVIDSEEYEVKSKSAWKNNVINHYRYVVIKEIE